MNREEVYMKAALRALRMAARHPVLGDVSREAKKAARKEALDRLRMAIQGPVS